MTVFVVFLLSVGGTHDPKTGPWPGPFIRVLDAAPLPVKRYVANGFAAKNLYFPDRETVQYEEVHGWKGSYRGAINVFWRRAVGYPLDRFQDPILGWRPPGFQIVP